MTSVKPMKPVSTYRSVNLCMSSLQCHVLSTSTVHVSLHVSLLVLVLLNAGQLPCFIHGRKSARPSLRAITGCQQRRRSRRRLTQKPLFPGQRAALRAHCGAGAQQRGFLSRLKRHRRGVARQVDCPWHCDRIVSQHL